jgi:hypothetical protein
METTDSRDSVNARAQQVSQNPADKTAGADIKDRPHLTPTSLRDLREIFPGCAAGPRVQVAKRLRVFEFIFEFIDKSQAGAYESWCRVFLAIPFPHEGSTEPSTEFSICCELFCES